MRVVHPPVAVGVRGHRAATREPLPTRRATVRHVRVVRPRVHHQLGTERERGRTNRARQSVGSAEAAARPSLVASAAVAGKRPFARPTRERLRVDVTPPRAGRRRIRADFAFFAFHVRAVAAVRRSTNRDAVGRGYLRTVFGRSTAEKTITPWCP